ncbi:MAG TPA: hypothetical protein VGQ15_03975 [Gaiellaceae bacterium]|nr:hypothetical protein [Gaiellaceae bacterium]
MPATCFTCAPKAAYGVLGPYGVDRPRSVRPPRALTRSPNSKARRDFPMPGGPKSVTSCARHSSMTRLQMPESSSSSRSRPIMGASESRRWPASVIAFTANQTLIG